MTVDTNQTHLSQRRLSVPLHVTMALTLTRQDSYTEERSESCCKSTISVKTTTASFACYQEKRSWKLGGMQGAFAPVDL